MWTERLTSKTNIGPHDIKESFINLAQQSRYLIIHLATILFLKIFLTLAVLIESTLKLLFFKYWKET